MVVSNKRLASIHQSSSSLYVFTVELERGKRVRAFRDSEGRQWGNTLGPRGKKKKGKEE